MNTITLLIASPDSATQSRLAAALSREIDMRVINQAQDLTETYANAEELIPTVALIDQRLMAAPEFEVIRGLFGALDIRWLAIRRESTESQVGHHRGGADIFGIDSLTDTVSLVNLIRTAVNAPRRSLGLGQKKPNQSSESWKKIVLIGSSTGGVDALIEVLRKYPSNCPPTLIVQHTGNKLVESLAKLLDRHCPATVRAVQDEMRLKSGMIGLAAARNGHLKLKPRRPISAHIESGDKVSGHAPSVDALFTSANRIAPHIVAVLLTGMGKDGAVGMLELRNNGATTIGQNKATSVVYGMPRVAYEMNAVEKQLPLNQISASILEAARIAPAVQACK